MLLLPAGAEAAGKRLVGVNSIPTPTQAQLNRMAAAGTHTCRVHFNWRLIEGAPGVRDWARIDALVADAARAGVKLLPFILESPSWVSPDPAAPPIYSSGARSAWSSFVAALGARYGANGSFWRLNPGLPRSPIGAYQIWNEVNLRQFWGSRPSPRGYAQLVKLASKALRSTDPTADVVLAGLLPFKSIGVTSVSGHKFLRRLFRVKGMRKHADKVAIHPYATHPRLVLRNLRRARKTLSKARVKKPIWVTEFGWSTGGELWNVSPVRATPTQQAAWVSKSYRLMRKASKRLRLQRALYFNFTDFDNPGTDYWDARMGLFDLNGRPKPAWFSYARRAGGSP